MSINSLKCDRPNRQPIILLRKRKAESDIEISSPSDMSSPAHSECSVILSSCESSPYTETDSADEQESADYPLIPSTFSEFRGLAGRMKPFSLTCRRKSPLPEVSWAEQSDLWQSLVLKDTIYRKNPKILLNHPEIEPNMRAIVLDWLTEVCQVYKLHRETYYLAQDYIDRFLMLKSNLPKSCLQLLGITALFVAAKMEEIYPPRLDQYSYVTDNACSDSDILAQEVVLIMALKWDLSTVTISTWLNAFLQLAYIEDSENLIGPEKFPRNMFIQISQVLDLCILDIECLRYPYSVLVASAVAHFLSKETAMHVSGLSWEELLPCVTWMKPFVEVAQENGGVDLRIFSDVSSDDWYNIQTHSAGLKLLEQVHEKQIEAAQESPSLAIRQLTPPLSNKKMNSMNIEN